MQLVHAFLGNACCKEFLVDLVQTYLVQLVNSHGDIHYLVGLTNDVGNAGEYLAVVNLEAHTDTELGKYGVHNLHQLHLVQERITAHHIGIALIELAITSLLRTVGTPYGLNLIATEGHLQFLAVLHHIACKGHGQVIAQSLLGELRGQTTNGIVRPLLSCDVRTEIATIQYLEQELVALFAILAHQGGEVLHGWGFYLLKAIQGIYRTDGIKNIIAAGHLYRTEVARTLWNTWFHIANIKMCR